MIRVIGRSVLILAWLAACLPVHGLWRAAGRASPWPARFLGGVGWLCGARVQVLGRRPDGRALVVSNHVSWLDILVLGGALRARFVSKSDIAHAPIVGWLSRLNDTVFIAREERGGAARQAGALRSALSGPRPVVMFPEGTTNDGRTVLPFRSSLFAAVAPPPAGVSVHPLCLDYGAAREAVAWYGDEAALPSLRRVLARPGSFPVLVRILPALEPTGDRKALAREAERMVASALRDQPPR